MTTMGQNPIRAWPTSASGADAGGVGAASPPGRRDRHECGRRRGASRHYRIPFHSPPSIITAVTVARPVRRASHIDPPSVRYLVHRSGRDPTV